MAGLGTAAEAVEVGLGSSLVEGHCYCGLEGGWTDNRLVSLAGLKGK